MLTNSIFLKQHDLFSKKQQHILGLDLESVSNHWGENVNGSLKDYSLKIK
jgi:hypothetical protein